MSDQGQMENVISLESGQLQIKDQRSPNRPPFFGFFGSYKNWFVVKVEASPIPHIRQG